MTLNEEECLTLLTANLGLGLRPYKNEGLLHHVMTLNDLAGAQDVIYFVTLACYLLQNQDFNQSKSQAMFQELNELYQKYSFYDMNEAYIPDLIQYYAEKIGIHGYFNGPNAQQVLPEAEECCLLRFYQTHEKALSSVLVFDSKSLDYPKVATLRQALLDNMNQQLRNRLAQNQKLFDEKKYMTYVLVSLDASSDEVLSQYHFHKDAPLEEHTASVLLWLKYSLMMFKQAHIPEPEEILSEVAEEEPVSWMQLGVDYCTRNKNSIALTAFGFFTTLGMASIADMMSSAEQNQL